MVVAGGSTRQHTRVFAAALAEIGAAPGTTLLVDRTAMGVPQFAFAAYTTFPRGDAGLAHVMKPLLQAANATRAPVPACLAGVGKIVQFVRDGDGHWAKVAEVQVWIS